jgi:hypothetical protein
MPHAFLADLLTVLHLAFVLFVVGGGLLVVRRPGLAWLHVPALLWGAGIELSGSVCPLTPLENSLRVAAGQAGYAGGFVDRYLLPVLYPAGLSRELQIGMGLAVLVLNAAVYARVLRRGARNRPMEQRRP